MKLGIEIILLCVVLLFNFSAGASTSVFKSNDIRFQRKARGINIRDFFSKSTTAAPQPSTLPPKLPNNLVIGHCEEDDQV